MKKKRKIKNVYYLHRDPESNMIMETQQEPWWCEDEQWWTVGMAVCRPYCSAAMFYERHGWAIKPGECYEIVEEWR